MAIFALGFGAQARAQLNPPQQEWQDSLRAKVPELNALTGMSLSPDDIYVFDGIAELDGPASERTTNEAVCEEILTWTDESDATIDRFLGLAWEVNRSVVREGSRDVVHWDQTERGNACLIYFPGHALAQVGRDKESTIYHELFHCYQFEAIGGSPFRSFPVWFTEGMAEWVGEQLTGGTDLGGERFADYLSTAHDMPLFERDYDAFPFYSHLANWTDPSLVFADFRSWISLTSSNIFSAAVSADSNTLVRSWAGGVWRALQNGEPDWGPEWNTDVPGSPAVSTVYRKREVRGTGRFFVTPYKPAHFQFHLNDEQFYKVTFTDTWGRIRITKDDGSVEDIPINGEELSLKMCLGIECACPNGSRPLDDDEIIRVGNSPIPIAVVAQENRGQVEVEEVEPTCCGDDLLDPRLVGTWQLDDSDLIFLPWFDRDICQESVTGSHTLRIGPFGEVTKSYGDLQMRQVCEFSEALIVVTLDSVNGTVTGCLSTGDERTFQGTPVIDVDFQMVSDSVSFQRTVDGEFVPSGWQGEPHYLQFGAFDESETEQLSIVLFKGDDIEFLKWFISQGDRLYHRIGD